MFERKTKKVKFQDGEITIGSLSVYRTLAMRTKYREIKEEQNDERVDIMVDVIAESLVEPVMTAEDIKALDMDTFDELLDVVIHNNGIIAPEKNAEPSTT